jgi:hypothetical protein
MLNRSYPTPQCNIPHRNATFKPVGYQPVRDQLSAFNLKFLLIGVAEISGMGIYSQHSVPSLLPRNLNIYAGLRIIVAETRLNQVTAAIIDADYVIINFRVGRLRARRGLNI